MERHNGEPRAGDPHDAERRDAEPHAAAGERGRASDPVGWPGAPRSVRLVSRLVQLTDFPLSRRGRVLVSVSVIAGALLPTAVFSRLTDVGRFTWATLAVVTAAWFAGLRYALAVAVTLAVIITFLWIGPRFDLATVRPQDYVAVAAFIAVSFSLGAFVDALRALERRSRRQANQLRVRSRELEATAQLAATAEHEARGADQAKSRFLATMSHELRTPLTAIIGYCELLAEEVTGPVSHEQKTQLGRIRASALHLLQLISEILMLSKIEAGKETLHLEPVRVEDVLREGEEQARALLSGKAIELRAPATDRALVVHTDHLKVRQVVFNLISNAVKFTERGAIELWAEPDSHRVLIHVRDTGLGISPHELDRIWEAFEQGVAGVQTRVGGTGLGLNLSRRIARLLGGDVSVESEPGRGSTFTFWLPLAGPDLSPDERASLAPSESGMISLRPE